MSSNQLFKKFIPLDLLFDFIEQISNGNDNYYLINKTSFKQAKFHNILEKFCNDIKPFYHVSKQKYVTRELNFSKFITIIRQICNSHNIKYSSKMLYNKSSYDISYYIYK